MSKHTPWTTKDIGRFEPGDIRCVECDWKPEDPWDTEPDGFWNVGDDCYCDLCAKQLSTKNVSGK